MFQLNKEEFENWKSQFATSNSDESLRSQFATSTEEENWKSQIAISIPNENMSSQNVTTSDEFLRSQIATIENEGNGLRSQIVTLEKVDMRGKHVKFLPISPIANRVTSSIVPDVIRCPLSISPALDAGFVHFAE